MEAVSDPEGVARGIERFTRLQRFAEQWKKENQGAFRGMWLGVCEEYVIVVKTKKELLKLLGSHAPESVIAHLGPDPMASFH